MTDQDTIYLKVTISREVSRRLKVFVANKYPDLLRGPLSEEVEKALVQYLDSKKENNKIQNTHAHKHHQEEEFQHQHHHHQQYQQQQQQNKEQQSSNNTKYQRLIETIKRYSNSQRQITSGLARKAIQQTIGKDQRTIDKYLKILQEEDIIYGNSLDGMYDIQSWVFGDSIIKIKKDTEESQKQTTMNNNNNNNNNNNSWSRI